MNWEKLGKIFNPKDHQLVHNCQEFAQSPQALVLEDRVRIYFCTRERDSVGKYLSHVAFADFDLEMRSLIGVSKHEIIPLGGLGAFDEHGIFPFSVFKDGHRILSYTTGWNRKVSVSADASIGLVESDDLGHVFRRVGPGPILAASLHEPFLVADAYVLKIGELYHMWYIYGTKWKVFQKGGVPERVYKIAHATSTDAVTWKRESKPIITDKLNEDECQALPSVISIGNTYHMYFCYRSAEGFRSDHSKAYRIGYAYSNDLVTWKRDDEKGGINVSSSGWDSEMQCYPNVFKARDKIYMLYNGNEFGRRGFGLAVLNQ